MNKILTFEHPGQSEVYNVDFDAGCADGVFTTTRSKLVLLARRVIL